MLTNLTIRNFKRFDEVEIELGDPVVFIGPNNSGKTSAMQALALWKLGLNRWIEQRAGVTASGKRPGVTVNRRDLVAIPTPSANLFWNDRHTRRVRRVDGGQQTDNIRIEIVVDGVEARRMWSCGLEFDYANPESFYCRPLRTSQGKPPKRMPVPEEAGRVRVAFLGPMSGLSANEIRIDAGAIDVRIGEGRTAEVLRNLCLRLHDEQPDLWARLVDDIERLFGACLDQPRYVSERGEITMSYRERGISLDLSSSGRGLQQTLLLLAYIYANPATVVLLDEPDAHLEILRQRQIYQHIHEVAGSGRNQIIAASHSEVLLEDAARKDMVIAFVGRPHRIDDRVSQLRKSLNEIGFDEYVQAEQNGWILYLEGPTDLSILQAFAHRLGNKEASAALERPFVQYVGNQLKKAKSHFHGLREALPRLKGVVILDRAFSGSALHGTSGSAQHGAETSKEDDLLCLTWRRREIENYLCSRATLENYAAAMARAHTAEHTGPLFEEIEIEKRQRAMAQSIDKVEKAMTVLKKGSPWSADAKVSDDFLKPLFEEYAQRLSMPNLMNKTNFHVLAAHTPTDEISPEVVEKLEAITRCAQNAEPA